MSRSIIYTRPKASAEETLLAYLVKKFAYLTESQWREHISAKHVAVNENVELTGDEVLRQRDVVCFSPPRSLEPAVDEVNVKLLYEDAGVLVCVKNGDLPVAEGGRYCQNTLIGVLHRRRSDAPSSCGPTIGEASSPASTTHGKRAREVSVPTTPSVSKGGEENAPCHAPRDQRAGFYTVHRLDKETSGIVVVAKSPSIANELRAAFEAHSAALCEALEVTTTITAAVFETLHSNAGAVQKSYVALLAGAAPVGTDCVVTARVGSLAEHPAYMHCPEHQRLKKLKMVCQPEAAEEAGAFGKRACSRVVILASSERLGLSYARIDILTGRSHQIRLHCAHMGYPVLGDKLYTTRTPGQPGGCSVVADDVYLARVRGVDPREGGPAYTEDALAPTWSCRRHLLHAAKLSFPRPGPVQETLTFCESPLEWFMRDLRVSVAGRADADTHPPDVQTVREMISANWPLV